MANFDLNQYEPVEDRIKKFYEDNTDGRIITDIFYHDDERVIVKAHLYKSSDDQEHDRPWSTGIAQEFRDTEMKQNRFGKEYETVNYSSHVENCETSAIGRALANANYCGSKGRPSREEMEKVDRVNTSGTPLSGKQVIMIKNLLRQLDVTGDKRDAIVAQATTSQKASELIKQLMEKVQKKQEAEGAIDE